MKKTQKGVTLVEVLVSIAVFTVISLALISSVIVMKNVIIRQEEYAKIEMACYDMDAYYEQDPDKWAEKYFGEGVQDIGYLTADFTPTNDENQGAYLVRFSANVITEITNKDRSIIYVKNVTLTKEEVSNEE